MKRGPTRADAAAGDRTSFLPSSFILHPSSFILLPLLTLAVVGCWSSDGRVEPGSTELSSDAVPPGSGSSAPPEKSTATTPIAREVPDGVPAAEQEPRTQRPGGVPEPGDNPLRPGDDASAVGHSEGVASASDDTPAPGHGEPGDEPFDPVKENGPIFEGWPDPKAALVITGRQEGYLEPCGCAGLDRMKGGLNRRYSMFRDLRSRGWPVSGLDVGGLVEDSGPQAELKLQTTVNAMQVMNYDVIALGKTDLRFSAGNLIFAGTGDQSPFVSANAALFGFDAALTPQKRIVEVGGMKLGVTSVLGQKWQKEINNPDIELADPRAVLAKLLPELRQECDLVILLAHATEEESIELAQEFPSIDIVVTAGGPPEPPDQPQTIGGTKTMLVKVGEKGTHAVVLGLYDDPAQPVRYQRVPLDSRFAQSEEMRQLMEVYQDRLKDAGLEGLGIREEPLPRRELLGRFVGSEECKSCHEESYRVWKKSGHAKAWKTLVELDPPRNYDPECFRCHVVGWHPQNNFPYQSGFLSEEKTPHLVDVGCETCHGPGEAHVKAEEGADFELQEKLQKAAVITLEESQQAVSRALSDQQPCMNCHDGENSPDFNFQTYWPKIEHREE